MKKRKLISRYLAKWVERLGLRWWSIEVRYYDDPSTILKTFSNPGTTDDLTLAVTAVQWKYSQAWIDINLPACRVLSNERLEQMVIHELCHILVNEMREGELHHEERVVTGLTKAIGWVDQYARREKKNG